jgi:hypothetical protein
VGGDNGIDGSIRDDQDHRAHEQLADHFSRLSEDDVRAGLPSGWIAQFLSIFVMPSARPRPSAMIETRK